MASKELSGDRSSVAEIRLVQAKASIDIQFFKVSTDASIQACQFGSYFIKGI
jgi:hypothetical protein